MEPPKVESHRQVIPRSKINKDDLWWTFIGKSSKGQKLIIKVTYGGPIRVSHPKVEN